MKRKNPFEGKTLMYAARALGFCAKGYRIYLLRDDADLVGRITAEDYELGRILVARPELKHCRVISAEEYYGVRIFRVRQPV